MLRGTSMSHCMSRGNLAETTLSTGRQTVILKPVYIRNFVDGGIFFENKSNGKYEDYN